jgi:hypothetical protein
VAGILAAVDWLVDHQVLIAVFVLVALAVAGLTVLVVRGLELSRTARAGMSTLEQPVAAINDGLADAERRMDVIAAGQEELTVALDRVGVQTGELRIMLDHVARAFEVLRSPLRYLGR